MKAQPHFSIKQKNSAFWKNVFRTGMTPDGANVIAKPLNTVEMIQV